jgi:transposase-like protein
MSLSKDILSQLMENKNRGKGTLLEGLEELLKEKMKEMIKEVLEEVAHEEREMFFEDERSKRSGNRRNGITEEEQQKDIMNNNNSAVTKQILKSRANHSSSRANSKDANRKNGFYNRNLLTHIGEVNLNIPRDRYGDFHSFFIDRYSRNLFTISELVISIYQGGLSTRDITKTLNNLLGKKYSPYWVSRITDKLIEQVDKWKNRNIEEYFPIIYMDGLYVKIRRGGITDSESFVVAIGINQYGYREVLGFIESSGGESRETYREMLINLRNRGLKEPLLFILDGLIGIESIIKEIYPYVEFQSCIIHKMRHTLLKVRKRDRENVSEDLKAYCSSGYKGGVLKGIQSVSV